MAGALAAGIAIGVLVAGRGGGHESSSVTEPPTTSTTTTSTTTSTAPPAGGSIVRVDHTWTCRKPVDLALVRVTMTAAAAAGPRKHADAIHLRAGCTGRIGRIEVTQSAADGVKVAQGVHDLEIDGGFVHCLAKAPTLHQDGIQVLGGDRITFRNVDVDCGRPDATLVNANLFINQAGRSTEPPTDVVCDHCRFGGDAAHTVSIQNSVRSGVTDSTFCPAKYPRLTFTVGPEATEPVTGGNLLGACAGQEVGQPVEPGGS